MAANWAPSSVQFEVERDGNEVTISARGESTNFVLTSSLEGATVLAATLARATDEPPAARQRFSISKTRLEVSK